VSSEDAEIDRAALAAEALAKAKADAQARGVRRASPARAAPSAGRARRDDPAPLDAAIDGLINEAGWELAVATGSVFGRWTQIVGPDLAAHTTPEALADGELIVVADSTAWATQLRLLAAELVRRLNAELGDGSVRRVQVRGPGSATRRPGQWRVKGSRGPRDTYG
jgi:predicted nucleic acid-binding Zn ribbon protein